MSELNDEMKEWTEETGTSRFDKPSLTVKEICEFMEYGLADKDMGEIEDFLLRLESYNLWLRNTCGSVLATIRSVEKEYNEIIARGFKSLGKQFASNDIKEAMICNKNPKAEKIKNRLTRLRMKYDKISRIPQSIDASIRSIENAVRRRSGS